MFNSYHNSAPTSYFHSTQGIIYNPRKSSSCSSSLEEFSTESPFSHESDKNFEKFLNLDEHPADSPKRECQDFISEKIEMNQMTPLKLPPATTFDVNSLPPQQIAMLHQQGIFPSFGVDLRYFSGFRIPINPTQSTTSHIPTATTSPARFIDIRATPCPELNERNYKKILEKSKRIMKREKAKNRSLLKQTSKNSSDGSTATSVTVTPPIQPLPEIIEEEQMAMNDKASSLVTGTSQNEAACKKQREMMQKIRNRISAQQSRDRRKEYIQNLERENQSLKLDNQRLKEKLQKQLQKQQGKKIKFEAESPEKSFSNNDLESNSYLGGRDNMIFLALFTLFSLVLFMNYSQKTIFGKSNAVGTDAAMTGGDLFMERPLSISNNLEIEDRAGLKAK